MYLKTKKMSELPQEYTGSTKTQHDMLYGEVASGSNFEQMYANGLAKCGDLGFDLPQSLRAGYGEDISDDLINEKAREVISFSAKLAEDMQLSSAFFEKPANTVMLTAIAESWLDNEKRSNETNADKNQLVAEREMLVDIACMLAGKESAGVEDIAHHNPVSKDRYIEAADEQDAMRKEAFLDANVDSDLSNLVTEILNADGQGSFLEDQRELLGISADSQEPFRVKVINIAD